MGRLFLDSPEEGGRRLVWLAAGVPGVTWESGRYYEGNRLATSSPRANDPELARELWERSAEMVGLCGGGHCDCPVLSLHEGGGCENAAPG